jgi:hypothetical protein
MQSSDRTDVQHVAFHELAHEFPLPALTPAHARRSHFFYLDDCIFSRYQLEVEPS